MSDAKATSSVGLLPMAGRGFTEPAAAAAHLAWQRTVDFFKKNLRA